MRNEEYEEMIGQFDQSPDMGLSYYVIGLAGETGEVAELIKKSLRTGEWHKPLDHRALALELGDVLWYLTRMTNAIGVPLSELMDRNIEKLTQRFLKAQVAREAKELATMRSDRR